MVAATALMLPLLAAGCEATPTQQYTDALAAWDARQYTRALADAQGAQIAAERAQDTEVREKAAYLAGLAAFQLGRMDDASRSFAPVTRSKDATLAGKANAMLGAIALEQSRWADAASLYTTAAGALTGKDAEEARTLARSAQDRAAGTRRLAGTPHASTSERPAQAATTPAARASSPPSSTTNAGALTIVAGTYTSEVAARQRASTLAEATKRAGLATARVVPASAPDRRVWIVEIGSFPSRAAADAAMKKLPATGCVVAPSQVR